MKKMMMLVATLMVAILAVSCGSLMSAEKRESARASIETQYELGSLTKAQRDAAIEALDQPSTDWSSLLGNAVSLLGSIFLGVPISVAMVNKVRGPNEAQRQAAKTAAAVQQFQQLAAGQQVSGGGDR